MCLKFRCICIEIVKRCLSNLSSAIGANAVEISPDVVGRALYMTHLDVDPLKFGPRLRKRGLVHELPRHGVDGFDR